MPCFVIHWHAYFPTGLFYLLPGPCLPCSKFDVSGYQFIPTWNKEKFMIRDKQLHIHKHHQNTTFKHELHAYEACVFLHLLHFSTANCLSIFLIFHQYFFSLSLTDIVCATQTMYRTMGSVFSWWNPAAVCRQRETSLASGGAQDGLLLENSPCWSSYKVWASVALLPTAWGHACLPCPPGPLLGEAAAHEKVVCHFSQSANHPDATVLLQLFSKF